MHTPDEHYGHLSRLSAANLFIYLFIYLERPYVEGPLSTTETCEVQNGAESASAKQEHMASEMKKIPTTNKTSWKIYGKAVSQTSVAP